METKTCPMCAEEILEAAKKCKHCGEIVVEEEYEIEEIEEENEDMVRILYNLSKSDNRTDLECSFCDYDGPMCIDSQTVPWYFSLWIILPLFFTGVGILWVFFLAMFRERYTTFYCRCPDCEEIVNKIGY